MRSSTSLMLRRFVQSAIIMAIQPYVCRELPAWGKIYRFFADYRRDYLWRDATPRFVRNKSTGHLTRQDLSKWPDRSMFFLGRWYDLEMQSFVASVLVSTDTVVDVGANRGEFSLFASSLVPRGKVIAFEPNPACVRIFRDDIERNHIKNVVLFPIGLSDENSELTLLVPAENSGEATFVRSIARNSSAQEAAKVRRGDEILANDDPKLIKIDVEGFERRVIDGLTETIERCSPILIIEMIRQHLKLSGTAPEELYNLLRSKGYRGYRLSLRKVGRRYTHNLESLNLSENAYDAVWLPDQAVGAGSK